MGPGPRRLVNDRSNSRHPILPHDLWAKLGVTRRGTPDMGAIVGETDRQEALLAIDTSSDQAGLALAAGDRLAALAWHAGRTHTVSLLPQIDRLLLLHGIAVGDLSAVAVATGPGAFTGLRVGLSVAKGLAFALGVPIVGVPTLEAAALPFLTDGRPVVAAVAAGRGRLVWAIYGRAADDQPVEIAPPRNGTIDDLRRSLVDLGEPAVVVGEVPAAVDLAAASTWVVPRPLAMRRPEALLTLARHRIERGTFADLVDLEPFYLGRGA